jgi:hypothetical protein
MTELRLQLIRPDLIARTESLSDEPSHDAW